MTREPHRDQPPAGRLREGPPNSAKIDQVGFIQFYYLLCIIWSRVY